VKPAVDYSMEAVDLAAEQVNSVRMSGAEHVQAANDAVLKACDYTISQICNAKDQGIQQVETIYSGTSNKMEEYCSSTGSEKIKKVMDTSYVTALSKQLDHSLMWSEMFIEQYLPEIEDLGENTGEEYQDETSTLERALALTNKTRQRLSQHALINLKLLQVKTQEAADKLNFNYDLINYAKTNLVVLCSMLSLKLSTIWREMKQKKEDLVNQTGMGEHLIATARDVVHICNKGISASSYGLSLVPNFLMEKFEKLKTHRDDLQEMVKVAGGLSEIRSILLEQAVGKLATSRDSVTNMLLICKDKATLLQEKLTDSKDYFINTSFMTWMGINREDMSDQENIEMEAIANSSQMKKE